MIVERSMSPGYLSNTFLVGDRPGGSAVFVDAGAPLEMLIEATERENLTVTHLLLTHRHNDHVSLLGRIVRRFGCRVVAHPLEAAAIGDVDLEVDDGAELTCGEMRIRTLHAPGHTTGSLAYVVDDEAVFTGDTLFRGTVGGTVGSGHATVDDLKRSILDRLLRLPREMTVYPGHTDSTTIGRERDENPFVRLWTGVDPPQNVACHALGRPATLLLRALDYDGGTKCHVRWEETGGEDVVPGSRVTGDEGPEV
jgi:glyoxylase-like metal-dependent hydrolase (beta-lactamase superfamily II)